MSLKWMRALAALAVTAVVAVAFTYFLFAAPLSDDFLLAYKGRDVGWFDYAIRDTYFKFSGRWASYALLGAVLSRVDPTRYYPLLLGALAVLHVLGLYALGRVLLGAEMSRRATAWLATCCFALLWAGRPVLSQTIYWCSGAVAYQLGISLSLILIAVLSRTSRTPAGQASRVVGSAMLAVVIPGLNEMTGLMLCIVLFAGTGIAYRLRGPTRMTWTLVLIAAVIGFLVVFLAPGNAVRGLRFAGGDVWRTVTLTIRDVGQHVPNWILDPKLLAATVLLAVHPRLAELRPGWIDRCEVSWKWLVPLVSIVVLVAGFAGIHWATGGWVPGRVLDLVYVVFVIGWLASAFVWTRWPAGSPVSWSAPLRVLESGALVVLVLGLLVTGNTPLATTDLLNGRAVRWHRAMLARYETIHRMKQQGLQSVVVPRPPAQPRLFARFDLSSNPSSRRNRSAAGFFQLRAITVGPSPTGHSPPSGKPPGPAIPGPR